MYAYYIPYYAFSFFICYFSDCCKNPTPKDGSPAQTWPFPIEMGELTIGFDCLNDSIYLIHEVTSLVLLALTDKNLVKVVL